MLHLCDCLHISWSLLTFVYSNLCTHLRPLLNILPSKNIRLGISLKLNVLVRTYLLKQFLHALFLFLSACTDDTPRRFAIQNLVCFVKMSERTINAYSVINLPLYVLLPFKEQKFRSKSPQIVNFSRTHFVTDSNDWQERCAAVSLFNFGAKF